ncbi:MAG TPA: monothiol bacilliredoxin BrxC family protein [Trueperaceae bacterium]|nr:monothiol bacilliredoxin BrxC family protein [Trueperaceae bacterium]
MLKDRVVLLTSPEDVSEFLDQYPTSVIFKAGTCHKTMQGFGFVQEKLEPREDLMCGVIRVVEARAASNLVAERTNVHHESPQVIMFADGQPVFNVDNWAITPEALTSGFSQLPSGEAVAVASDSARSNLAPYLTVLERYLNGDIDDQQFEFTYTHMFRDDSTLRPGDEVEALNSIFGDVDQHINMHLMMAGKADNSKLRARAESAYQRLKGLEQTPA